MPMRRRRLLWQLYSSYLLISLIALLALAGGAWWSLRHFYFSQTRRDLEMRARMMSYGVDGHYTPADIPLVDAYCKALGKRGDTRFTVILPSGQVIGDSESIPAQMQNHRDRPEVARALTGAVSDAVRYSATLKQDMMYLAVPEYADGQLAGIVRAAIPLTHYNQALGMLNSRLGLEIAVVALLLALVSLLVSRHISGPLEAVRGVARQWAQGDWQQRVPVSGSEEIAGLAITMNQMVDLLDERIRTVVRQRTEQEAVLKSMMEGVLAVDNDERLIKLNQAAANLLGTDAATAQGRSIQEVIRNSDLQRFIAGVLASTEAREAGIAFRLPNEQRFMQVHGTLLLDEEERRIGALVVMNDVTRLRHLETVRSDFVANVSHELKTPITSIKGFVETLLDGSLQQPEEAERFLQIIARHTDRMHAIIEDLLTLSRLEQQGEEAMIPLEHACVWDVLVAALQSCEVKAREKKIQVELGGDREWCAPINPALLEQAIINLIDNAIKYSAPESRVTATILPMDNETRIEVRDQGSGISREHLPRVFERFYRVDPGRSRKLGSTGLGLAIVKHIAQVHQGSVTVESTPGKGSTFTIHLPNATGLPLDDAPVEAA